MHQLSELDRQIASMIARGMATRQIAAALGLGFGTVAAYVERIRRTLDKRQEF